MALARKGKRGDGSGYEDQRKQRRQGRGGSKGRLIFLGQLCEAVHEIVATASTGPGYATQSRGFCRRKGSLKSRVKTSNRHPVHSSGGLDRKSSSK